MTTAIDTVEDLRRRHRGQVLLPGDPGFDERRRTFNAMLDRRPRAIVQPVDAADVATAVRWAGEHDLPISVRGGGHSVAGHAVGPDALMIDLGELRTVVVDRNARTADVGGGALLEDLDRATTRLGLAAPSGTYADTGVGGLTLSGGIGFILGRAGFACDALVGAEVVAADGAIVEVDAVREPDLLWALRGGGGNFGVVTRFRVGLVPLTTVYGGPMRFAGAAVPDVLRLVIELQGASAPDDLTLQAVLGVDPELGPTASALGAWIGDPGEGPRHWAAFRALPGAYVDEVGPTSYLAVQTMGDRMGPTFRHYWKSRFVTELSDELQALLVDAAAHAPDHSIVLVEPIHGRAHRIPADHAAFGSRQAAANVSALAIWSDPHDDAPAIEWSRRTVEALEPFALRGSAYLNYSSDDEPADRLAQSFGGPSWERLRAVKRRMDPGNRFRFNANIPPAKA